MPLSLDPEILAAAGPVFEAMAKIEPPPPGDWEARRQLADGMFLLLANARPAPADVRVTEHVAIASDGAHIPLSWYAKAGSSPGSAVCYIHGGGMISGSVDLYSLLIAEYVDETGVPMLAVDYRLAPEHRHPVPVEDGYTGLKYLHDHAATFGVDAGRIAVMGDSAGGGLAAAVALLARDRGGPPLARQILVYPMLDDRTTIPDAEIAPFATWSYADNVTGWGALLGEAAGGDDVPATAAPARASDLSGLPPAWIQVGDLDIFRDEDIDYARRLGRAGVPCELHVYSGAPHAFEAFAPEASVTRQAMADRHRALRAL